MAQVPSEVLTLRLPDMAGTETLTMVMSRISMNDAVAMAAVRNNSLPPRSGGYSSAAAGGAGSAMRGSEASELPQDFDARPHRPRHWPYRDPGNRPGYHPPATRPHPSPAPVRREKSCLPSLWPTDRRATG